ncbi:MAG: aldo/keto reductase [Caldilineaceae bacterium]|nr:aldo/keto reductase [Caldilineaceae bacterium]
MVFETAKSLPYCVEERMEYGIFGRTGLRVSVVGLGAGGPSKLGKATDRSEEESIALVRRALELGINYIDTAENYGTEEIIGKAIRGFDRHGLVLSTKKSTFRGDRPLQAKEFAEGVEASLRRLGVETIDIFHFHGPTLDKYPHAVEVLVPELLRLQQAGKIGHLAVSERFPADLEHGVLRQAIADDIFDVVMVGFNILNQTAREEVLPAAAERGVATECMFAVRRAFCRPDRFKEILGELGDCGEIDADIVDMSDPLAWALEASSAGSVPELAYRFCRYEPGIDLVLTGTGNAQHLEENVASMLKPPLPAEVTKRLRLMFGRVRSASGW